MRASPPRAAEPAFPQTEVDEEALLALIPPYRVILHNDDHNSMDHVVESLIRCVPSLTIEAAAAIMVEAHTEGQATVIEMPEGSGRALPRDARIVRPHCNHRACVASSRVRLSPKQGAPASPPRGDGVIPPSAS